MVSWRSVFLSVVLYVGLPHLLVLDQSIAFQEGEQVQATSQPTTTQPTTTQQDSPSTTNRFEQKYLEALAKQKQAKQTQPRNAGPILNQQNDAPAIEVDNTQQAAYEHILFEYFQQNYDRSLMLIEVGDSLHQFANISYEDQDRLRLMQGASQLKVGLYRQAQEALLALLAKTSSQYVQANTWYWLAKAGFENRQYYLSEQAFNAIEQNNLIEFIRPEQWQELIYLTVFTRMQQGQSWQQGFKKLEQTTIYPAYIHANHASMQFNAGDYAQAEASFIAAKQAVLRYQNIQNSWLKKAGESVSSWLDFAWINPLNWFSSDPNVQAQAKLEAEQESKEQKEIDALYDRINLGLAYALLQQQDEQNALNVINTISTLGGESEQALLTLGWAMAQQNRWQNALSVWQYLRKRSPGLYGLQASYGIAYAFQQQGDFTQAFFALDDTTTQIQNTLVALEQFSARIQQDDFFDALSPGALDTANALNNNRSEETQSIQSRSDKQGNTRRVSSISELGRALGLESAQNSVYREQGASFEGNTRDISPAWPDNLLDIKRVFLSSRADFDAGFLLSVRREAQQALVRLTEKAKQLRTLEQMLSIRQQRYAQRQQNLSLERAGQRLDEAQARLDVIASLLQDGQDSAGLSLQMASPEQAQQARRLSNAQGRLVRLQTEGEQPLNPKYAERLARLQGVLQWQLADNFIAKHWQHKAYLAQAQRALNDAKVRYQSLQARQQDTQLFANQQAQINALAITVLNQQSQARKIYQQANTQLQQNLQAIIEQRVEQLNTQEVNTRLAKIRLQDLTPEAL